MEYSVSSSPNTVLSPSKSITEAEESGWTQYLDDFSAYNKDKHDYNSCCSSSLMSASMVSDAGSGPDWKNKNKSINQFDAAASAASLSVLPNMPKRLSFMKKRTQETPFDHSLEDTASSPVNSPKITMCFKRMDLNYRKLENDNGSHMGHEMSIDEQEEPNNIDIEHNVKGTFNNNKECINMKESGLCLVPVSLIANYLD